LIIFLHFFTHHPLRGKIVLPTSNSHKEVTPVGTPLYFGSRAVCLKPNVAPDFAMDWEVF
jgi:hypothetical protein